MFPLEQNVSGRGLQEYSRAPRFKMSDVKKLANAIRATTNALKGSIDKDAAQIASNLRALVQDRIIRTGTDARGLPFPPYAPLTVKLRNAKGRQTGHVDLYFTGEMWRGVGVVKERVLIFGVRYSIEGRTSPVQRKIDLNSERYGGSILEPSLEEIELTRRAWAAARIKLIQSKFK